MSRELTYADALDALARALTFGIHPSLDGIRALVAALGHPEAAYRSAQVTGTNGKTSVTRMLSAVLQAHGLRAGTYTSPHLESYTERIAVAGAPVSEAAFASALAVVLDTGVPRTGRDVDAFTEFELLTAAALVAFAEAGVLWAVLEVGMGGRWDATSVVSPAVSVVTGVALDHTDRLGSTRAAIAEDKAHIIKRGSVAVLGPGCEGVEEPLLARAAAVGAPVVRVGLPEPDVTWTVTAAPVEPGDLLELRVDGAFAPYAGLLVRAPSYQAPNVAVAVAAAEAGIGAPLDIDALRDALAAMTFPGRFELLRRQPPLIIDGAHNPDAAGVLAGAVREAFGDRSPVFILGVMADKDASGIVSVLAPVSAGFVCTRSHSDRALDPPELADVVRTAGGTVLGATTDMATALEMAENASGDGIVATGSIYIAGEVRALVDRE